VAIRIVAGEMPIAEKEMASLSAQLIDLVMKTTLND
jgi:hypothetical protein